MAGKIIADIIEAPAGRISLNVANVTVASINASGVFSSTGNLLITQAGTIGTGAITDGAVTNAKLTLAANASNIKTALNASGDAPIFAARAWVNYNGLANSIQSSGNVSSVTRNATGYYTVNLTTAMPDANYSVLISDGVSDGNWGSIRNIISGADPNSPFFVAHTTTAFTILAFTSFPNYTNVSRISIALFR
jgi:hypothetical protein